MNKSDYIEHPVFNTKFTILTGAIVDACNVALDAVFMRRTGLVFYGLSRVGKTRCARTLKNKLSGFMPRVYVTQIEVLKKEGPHTNNLLVQIGVEESCEFSSRSPAIFRFNMVVDRILLRCRERGCNQWVLLLDEFHYLRNYDLHLLGNIFNVLDRKNITMTVVSFGMPKVKGLRNETKAKKDFQLIARFMSDLIEFPGCRSISELKIVLETFDKKSEYPPLSGISYTQGLIPLAFANGLRLSHYANILWKSLNQSAVGAYKNNLPLEHLFLTLLYLLRFCAKNDSEKLIVTADIIEEAVSLSKIAEFTALNGEQVA